MCNGARIIATRRGRDWIAALVAMAPRSLVARLPF
jgi:hypothetical protein